MDADAIDRLYELPPSEFTPARDSLAKELRAGGDREAAAAVKALRKPSAGAWAINAAARRDAEALHALLDAGEALHRAQERLLAGDGDRDALRRAGEAERSAVAAMAAAAASSARDAGHPLSAAVQNRVRETLHAAALDERVREALAAGRIEREAEASGFAGAGAVMPASGAERRAGGKSASSAAAKDAVERIRREREAARAALADASRLVREAEREADQAARRLDRVEAAAEAARERLEAAERRQEAERDACAQAQHGLRAAKAAAAAAQAALDAAEA